MAKRHKRMGASAEAFSTVVTNWAGSTIGFGTALAVIALWALLGPVFGFSDTWQLVINTGTTIITFLMVFLIQRAQNKDALALHLKLNELVAVTKGASNRLVDVEALSEEEMRILERHFGELAALARKAANIAESHSIEEAASRHADKRAARPRAAGGGGKGD